MKPSFRKSVNLGVLMTVLIATLAVPAVFTVGSFWIPIASATTDSRVNFTNEQHNWSGGTGAPTCWCPTTCEAGSCSCYMNATFYDKNKAVGKENKVEGAMVPMNHTIWFHLNDTGNTTWIRNYTGTAGYGGNAEFYTTRADITTYGRVNVSYEFAVPAYFDTGRYYVNWNVTDNATTFTSSQIWDNDTYILVTGEGITTALLDEDGVDQNINTGYWGNITVNAGDTNVNFDANYIRIYNSGSYNTQQATINFVGTSWDSAKVGDSITIDTNIEWRGCWTNYSADNPGNSFSTQGSTWGSWQSDTSGSYEFEFYATGEYIWVQIRILAVPSPLGGADDYLATYTATASGVG